MATTRQRRWFTMGGSVFLTLACSLLVVYHVFQIMATALGLFVAVGFFFVDWVQWWATWWHANEDEDGRVMHTAFAVSLLLALTMAVSGGSVLITLAESWQRRDTAALDDERQRAVGLRQIEAQNAHAQRLAQLRQAGATQSTINREIARFDAQEKRAAAAEATRSLGAPLVAPTGSAGGPGAVLADALREFGRFWFCVVPPVLAILGLFSLAYALMLPGGASFAQTSAGRTAGMLPGREREDWPDEIEEPAPKVSPRR